MLGSGPPRVFETQEERREEGGIGVEGEDAAASPNFRSMSRFEHLDATRLCPNTLGLLDSRFKAEQTSKATKRTRRLLPQTHQGRGGLKTETPPSYASTTVNLTRLGNKT